MMLFMAGYVGLTCVGSFIFYIINIKQFKIKSVEFIGTFLL